MFRILLCDDEHDLVWAVGHSLRDEGYEVLSAYDGVEALALARRYRPDLVVLDVNMPRLDGLQVCHRLRRDPSLGAVPIIFLTVRNHVDDRIKGLDEGADDYLGKPFELRELKSRIRALLRRGPLARDADDRARSSSIIRGGLTLDLQGCQAQVSGKAIRLTPSEFDLLHHFMTHPGEVFSSHQLLRQVWGYEPESAEPGLVRWHMMNLRSKIEPDPARPVYIRTVPRHGYVFSNELE
jgi:DNA-binding response OmpR family regulator